VEASLSKRVFRHAHCYDNEVIGKGDESSVKEKKERQKAGIAHKKGKEAL